MTKKNVLIALALLLAVATYLYMTFSKTVKTNPAPYTKSTVNVWNGITPGEPITSINENTTGKFVGNLGSNVRKYNYLDDLRDPLLVGVSGGATIDFIRVPEKTAVPGSLDTVLKSLGVTPDLTLYLVGSPRTKADIFLQSGVGFEYLEGDNTIYRRIFFTPTTSSAFLEITKDIYSAKPTNSGN